MLFASLEYVVFLSLVFLLFWTLFRFGVGQEIRFLMLLVASWLFYMAWNALFIGLIIGSTLVDYVAGAMIARSERQRARKAWLIVSLVSNLGLLGLFKYFDFFLTNFDAALRLAGIEANLTPLGLMLPVGISFYTFQSMSYTIDIYRRKLEPVSSFARFSLFVAFFPQLVAGPIVRASEFLPQLDRRPRLSAEQAAEGIWLICKGLVKKIVIADFLAANLIDRIFEAPGQFGAPEVLIAVYAYTWQIYGDFAGYTDIARGSARLIGFELPINFDRPFTSANLAEFWRRWHMTLSRWIHDYLYISLGGSRRSGLRVYFNVAVAWFLIGLWHGAKWNFVFFGLWHALGMLAYRAWRNWRGERPPLTGWKRTLAVIGTFHFHVANWPLFRARTLEEAGQVYAQIFTGNWAVMRIAPSVLLVIALCFVVHFTPKDWVRRVRRSFVRAPAVAQAATVALLAMLLFRLASAQPVPHIYFQF